jgi:predicted Holliday junction resolvase-like endonuclease
MTAFLTWFEETKKIYGFCPCCGEMFHLSDVTIFTKTPPPQTPFDRIADQQTRLQRQIERFDEKEEEIREKAKATGQRKARRHLKKLSPYFFGATVDLKEVKLLFDPVEYVVFKGLSKANCSSVEFVDHQPDTKERELIQTSLDAAIHAGNIEWQTFRVETSGRIVPETTRRAAKPITAAPLPRPQTIPPTVVPPPLTLPLATGETQPDTAPKPPTV